MALLVNCIGETPSAIQNVLQACSFNGLKDSGHPSNYKCFMLVQGATVGVGACPAEVVLPSARHDLI